ncbi:MAG: PspC domain-containing protein [Bacteroidetes bacterium]|nr:PspC domain-containing protein [Bacteroidota bacterium]
MKKNISINISGIIFHVEEDGYEKLRQYLDAINQYFSKFDGSSEIIADLENRIAEIFHSKLSDDKQVITLEDVEALIQTMGGIDDFKASVASDEESASFENQTNQSKENADPHSSNQSAKKLYRNNRRKVLGGVCSGIAHYFKIDPVWLRLLLILLIPVANVFVFFGYMLMWIIVPESNDLDDQPSIKKIYRNTEDKVLGGVASGLSAYTGMDVSIIRILFVVGAFFGFGIIAYIIFWIAVPAAITLKEKMEMSGEPVTLSNIEKNVKSRLNISENEESTLSRILLFPFRAVATVLTGIGKALGPIAEIFVIFLRFVLGSVLVLTGGALLLSTAIFIGLFLGIISAGSFSSDWVNYFPSEAFLQTFSTWSLIAAPIILAIPSYFLMMSGVSLFTKKWMIGRITGLIMFILFVASCIWLTISLPSMILKFSKGGSHRTSYWFPIQGSSPVFSLKDTGLEGYQATSIRFKGHDHDSILIVQTIESRGNSRQSAVENAKSVIHKIEQKDSLILVDSNIKFPKGTSFYAQEARVEIYVPYNLKFMVTQNFMEEVSSLHRYVSEDWSKETFLFDSTGLKCVSCTEKDTSFDQEFEDELEDPNVMDEYGFKNFDEIEISGVVDADIKRGENYAINISGSDFIKRNLRVSMENRTLIIKMKDGINLNLDEDDYDFRIHITLPELESLKVTGAGTIRVENFRQEEMEISLSGALKGYADVKSESIDINLTGATKMELEGKGNFLEANLLGASKLEAGDYTVESAEVETTGPCKATVNVRGKLERNEGMVGEIRNIQKNQEN